MRKIAFVLLVIFNFQCFAQKNSVRINALGLTGALVGFQYERKLNKTISINNTIAFRPKTNIPLGGPLDKTAKKYGLGLTGIKFEYIFIDQAQAGLLAYSPEVRTYLGKNKKWFLGLVGQLEKLEMKVPASLPVRFNGFTAEATVPVDFKFRTTSAGILIGKKFSKGKFDLEWVIIGGRFGKAKDFDVSVKSDLFEKLGPDDQAFIIEKLKERFGVSDTYFATTIDATGAYIKSIKPSPYFGLRGFGLNLGYRF